jgi:hypothetical protein
MKVLLRKSIKSKHVKRISMILCVVVFGLIVVWARAFYGSMQAYQKGEIFLGEKQYVRAVTFFDRSIHWYTPFNPYVRRSSERLWDIGEQAEREGDLQLALMAYRTIRRGYYGASHFITPGMVWIKKSERKINTLLGLEEKEEKVTDETASLRGKLLADQKSASPDVLWTIVLEIGFIGWIGSIICLILFTLRRKKEDSYPTLPTFLWIASAVLFFVLWIIGMMKA